LPPSVERHLVRADILRGQGQALPAAEELRKALALSPGNVQIERDLAGALFAARQTDEALPLLEKLVAQTPDDPELAVGYAVMLVQTQQMDAAIPLLERALAARPTLLPAHAALGRARMAKGDAAAAVPHLEQALPTDEDGSLHYQLAQAYQQTNQPDRAKAMLAKFQEMQAAAPPAEASTPPAAITPPVP
jgi:predicted Zn-dependent protease